MAYPCISHNLLHRSPCAQPFFKPFCPDCLFHPLVFTSYPTDSETAVIAPLCRDSCHCAKPSPSPLATLASGCDLGCVETTRTETAKRSWYSWKDEKASDTKWYQVHRCVDKKASKIQVYLKHQATKSHWFWIYDVTIINDTIHQCHSFRLPTRQINGTRQGQQCLAPANLRTGQQMCKWFGWPSTRWTLPCRGKLLRTGLRLFQYLSIYLVNIKLSGR